MKKMQQECPLQVIGESDTIRSLEARQECYGDVVLMPELKIIEFRKLTIRVFDDVKG